MCCGRVRKLLTTDLTAPCVSSRVHCSLCARHLTLYACGMTLCCLYCQPPQQGSGHPRLAMPVAARSCRTRTSTTSACCLRFPGLPGQSMRVLMLADGTHVFCRQQAGLCLACWTKQRLLPGHADLDRVVDQRRPVAISCKPTALGAAVCCAQGAVAGAVKNSSSSRRTVLEVLAGQE